jgi:hypothetical protein
MMTRWMGVALIASMLVQSAAQAQCCGGVAPSPVGAARMPEPVPCAAALPNLIEGPITPGQAPPGPPPELSLPSNHTGAFQCDNYAPECAWYLHLGAVGLERNRSGHQPLAVLDQQTGANFRLDTGVFPPRRDRVILDSAQVSEPYVVGPSGVIGITWCGNESLELRGWYLFDHTRTATVVNQGRVDGLFIHPPFGFTGDNGLWQQADVMSVKRESELGNVELNYLRDSAFLDLELILGVRYMHLDETYQVYTGDDDLTFRDVNGNPDPRRQATYTIHGINNLVIAQTGAEWDYLIWKFISCGIEGKAGLGADFVQQSHTLNRGDGFPGFPRSIRHDVLFSQVYETGVWLDLHFTERCRMRAGYQALWMLGVSVPQDGLNYNLGVHNGLNRNGSEFYHGPMVEMQFLF